MITGFQCGSPFNTETVTGKFRRGEGKIPYLKKEGRAKFSYRLEKEDVVYGLGENVRGINKRGWIYESFNTDNCYHREDTKSLYGAHNFLIIDGKEQFGIFFDYPGRITFDIGYSDPDLLKIELQDEDFGLYVIGTDAHKTCGYSAMEDIVRQFRRLIGRSYIPPKWAFGYGQSRWGYLNEADVRDVAEGYRNAGIGLDMVYLDIDYMERYKDFTVNREAYPDFAGLVSDMKKSGVHLVPIIDAAIKVESGYDVYEEGAANDYFCKDEEGNDYIAGAWPGRVVLPDVLNDKVRRWFGQKYKILIDMGIEGFWNDMNEPSIFFSEKYLAEVFRKLDKFRDENLDLEKFGEFGELVGKISNNPVYYKEFYHRTDSGVCLHEQVHNLYGYNLTRAAGEAFEELCPNHRILIFSRSSCIGMHRYGGIWTGDNQSFWEHLLMNMKMMPSLNMCGFLYTGADLGGFGSDTTQDLLMRWLAFGVFTPLMRNHSSIGTRRQEAYQFPGAAEIGNIIQLRYILLPYIYSEYVKAALGDDMYMKPLAFVYPEDDFAKEVEDQLMVGESIMIAPVYRQNAGGRYVYLPERMLMVRYQSPKQMQKEIVEKGHHYVEIGLKEVVFFILPDHLVPISSGGSCVEQIDFENLRIMGFVETYAEYKLYDDDGYTRDYDNPRCFTQIRAAKGKKLVWEGEKNSIEYFEF